MSKLFYFGLIALFFLNLNSGVGLLYFDFNNQADADTFADKVYKLTNHRTFQIYSSRKIIVEKHEYVRISFMDYDLTPHRLREYITDYLGFKGVYGFLYISDFEKYDLDWLERARELGINKNL